MTGRKSRPRCPGRGCARIRPGHGALRWAARQRAHWIVDLATRMSTFPADALRAPQAVGRGHLADQPTVSGVRGWGAWRPVPTIPAMPAHCSDGSAWSIVKKSRFISRALDDCREPQRRVPPLEGRPGRSPPQTARPPVEADRQPVHRCVQRMLPGGRPHQKLVADLAEHHQQVPDGSSQWGAAPRATWMTPDTDRGLEGRGNVSSRRPPATTGAGRFRASRLPQPGVSALSAEVGTTSGGGSSAARVAAGRSALGDGFPPRADAAGQEHQQRGRSACSGAA